MILERITCQVIASPRAVPGGTGVASVVHLTKAGVNPIIRRNLEDFDLCI
jgi:hypothetical protein